MSWEVIYKDIIDISTASYNLAHFPLVMKTVMM
jgi:hypothetical protein